MEPQGVSREQVAELYRRCGALVLRRCRLILGGEAEAEDALQEVFIRLMHYGASVREGTVPLSWLYRTAERCCFDRMKKSRREPLGASQELFDALAVSEGDERREAAEMIARFFHRLKPKLKQVALLHYVDGLTQERIALELGWSRRTVGKKLNQLRQRAGRLAVSTGGA